MKYVIFKNYRNDFYTFKCKSSHKLFPLAEFLTGDYRDFKDFYWEEFFDRGIPIDSGGNSTWIEEKKGKIEVMYQFGNNDKYTTTKKKFFKILKQWEKVVAKRPKKILIQEVDGEILIGPLEDDMN